MALHYCSDYDFALVRQVRDSTVQRFRSASCLDQGSPDGRAGSGGRQVDVLLESVRDDEMNCLRGRIHFVSGNTHRLSGWIFLEWAERDVDTRFGEFSAQELWSLLDSLG